MGHGKPPAERAAEQCTRRAALGRPAPGVPELRLRRVPWHDPIAPTVFPKGRSAARPLGRQAPSRGVACDPREEVAVSRSRTRRVPAWACPRMSSGERWPSASNPQTPPALAALATRLSGASGEFLAPGGRGLKPRALGPPGADRDSAFTCQSSGSRMGALQLWDMRSDCTRAAVPAGT